MPADLRFPPSVNQHPDCIDLEQGYDLWSPDYDAFENPMVLMAEHALRAMLPDLKGKDVLELGCGTGRNLAFMAGLGARRLAGLDLSQGMLDKAGQAIAGHDALLLKHDLTQPIPLPRESQDLVLLCLVLEHLPDVLHAHEEAYRLLRPGGSLMICEIHPFLTASGVGAHFKDAQGREHRLPSYTHSISSLLNKALEAGFAVKQVWEWLPDAVLRARSPKMRKHDGRPLLFGARYAKPESALNES